MLQTVLEQIWTLHFLAEGLIPLLLWLALYYAAYIFLRQLNRKGRIDEFWFRTWRHLSWIFYILALYQPIILLFPQLNEGLQRFGEVFTSPLLGKTSAPSLLALLSLIPIFYLSTRLAATCIKLLSLYFERSRTVTKRLYQSNIKALLTLGQYLLILLFFLFGINLVGINLSSLGVLLGALGLGIGFGLQNMAANFVSGITLLVSGHIQHGDFVRAKGVFGTVERIGLISTVVLTTKYENLIIPNQYLLNEIIENASYNNNRTVQLHLPLGVAYGSDLEQVEQLLRGILRRNPYRPSQAGLAPTQLQKEPQAGEQEQAQELGAAQSCTTASGTNSPEHSPQNEQTDAKAEVKAERLQQAPKNILAASPRSKSSKNEAASPRAGGSGQTDQQGEMFASRNSQKTHNKEVEKQGALDDQLYWGGDDVWLTGFGASSIDFEVRMMIDSINFYRAATHWFYMETWRTFQQHGVTIPFAQLDVHMHDGESGKQKSVTGFGS